MAPPAQALENKVCVGGLLQRPWRCQMVRLLQQSENPMSRQDLKVLGREVGWGLRGWWDDSALPLLAGQTMRYFLCLWGRLKFGEQWRRGPKRGWRKEQKRQHLGYHKPSGQKGTYTHIGLQARGPSFLF